MLLSDWALKARASMIEPFVSTSVKVNDAGEPIISYGLSSYGYDVRLADEFVIVTGSTLDPKVPLSQTSQRAFVANGKPVWLAAGDFILAKTLEKLTIPRDCAALCVGKSTYARCGIIVNTTPLEPEWTGHVTLEISNTSRQRVPLYPGEGIAQVMFFLGEQPCATSYADKKGKYQNQISVTPAKV